MLDKGGPFISIDEDCEGQSALLHLIESAYPTFGDVFDTNEKIHLLLQRGANVQKRNQYGKNCILLAFEFWAICKPLYIYKFSHTKDILMCLVTVGADIDACDKRGRSTSQYACKTGYEQLWMEVLAECGYDPKPVLCCLEEYYRGKDAGFGVFASDTSIVRSTKLSFAEYSKQRRSLGIYTDAEYYSDYVVWRKGRKELEEYVKSVEEESDSEDWEVYSEESDIYIMEHGADWWL